MPCHSNYFDHAMVNREALLEFTQIGNTVKVTAVDAETGIEASIVGPVNAGQETLKRTALQKLKYVMEKQAKEKS